MHNMYIYMYICTMIHTCTHDWILQSDTSKVAYLAAALPEAGLSGAGHHQGVAEIRGALGVCHGQEQAPWTGGDGCWMLRSWVFLLILEL